MNHDNPTLSMETTFRRPQSASTEVKAGSHEVVALFLAFIFKNCAA